MEGTKNTSVTLSNEKYDALERAARESGHKVGGYMRHLLDPFVDLALKGDFARIALLRKKLEREAAK